MGSRISHVYGSWKVHKDIRLVVGMESNGLDWRPLRKFRKTNTLVYAYKPVRGELASWEMLEEHLNWFAKEYANKAYAFKVLAVLFLFKVLGKLGSPGRWVRDKLHGVLSYLSLKLFGNDKEVCCSAYLELLQHVGDPCVDHLKSHENDTQELLEAISSSSDWELVYPADN